MAERIADRITATVPLRGCKVRTLRAVLHDIEAAPLDYAIQGLLSAGTYVMSDGFIRPRNGLAPATRSIVDTKHPWRQFLELRRGRS